MTHYYPTPLQKNSLHTMDQRHWNDLRNITFSLALTTTTL